MAVITDQFEYIEMVENEIWAENITLGNYNTEERAQEVFDDLVDKLSGGGCSKYIMPKE